MAFLIGLLAGAWVRCQRTTESPRLCFIAVPGRLAAPHNNTNTMKAKRVLTVDRLCFLGAILASLGFFNAQLIYYKTYATAPEQGPTSSAIITFGFLIAGVILYVARLKEKQSIEPADFGLCKLLGLSRFQLICVLCGYGVALIASIVTLSTIEAFDPEEGPLFMEDASSTTIVFSVLTLFSELFLVVSYFIDFGGKDDLDSVSKKLEQLKGLYDSGVLSQEEFETEKQKVLGVK